jgi:hypothetical protein
VLRKLLNIFNVKENQDFRGLYTDAPISFAEEFPEVPPPAPRLTPILLAAQWVSCDLRGEDMPDLASDLLEAGFDTPALRRLAGEGHVACSADVEGVVGRMFRELSVSYPLSETDARLIFTRQIAREVIAGERNAWAAASRLKIVMWAWRAENPEVETIFELRDELNWDNVNRGSIAAITRRLIETFARLGSSTQAEDCAF